MSVARVALYSQGCRLNHAETAMIHAQFESAGYTVVPFNTPADIIVINTCTVTENGDRDTRQLVNRAVKLSPSSKIALIGCQSQILKEKLLLLPNVHWVVGNDSKSNLIQYIQEIKTGVHTPKIKRQAFSMPLSSRPSLHTRANLKLQDGCDFYCSFCVIPFARGPARSRAFDNAIADAQALVSHGHRELVITGINVGTYAYEGYRLPDIINALELIDGLARIRISSIEPTTIDDAVFSRLQTQTKLCRYAHIPLQSGCDTVLARMKRQYTVQAYTDQLAKLISWCPDICIGTDVIVGFPGETEAEFETTYQTIADLPLAYCHVFSYSDRSITRSSRMIDRVPQAVIQARSARLRALSQEKTRAYRKRYLNTQVSVLLEQQKSGGWVGHTDTFIPVYVPGDHARHDRISGVIQSYTDKYAIIS